jgi:Predicted transcriptional regulators
MRDWLKEARKKEGLTMKALGEKLGVSESYYCMIENGARQIRMDMALAARISKELNISLDIISKYEARKI